MKKIITAVLLLCVCSAVSIHAQALLNTGRYLAAFSFKFDENISNNELVSLADNENYQRFAGLDGRDDLIDTGLEFALLTYYTPTVIGKRPPAANLLLPANNARNAGFSLGLAVYKGIVELRYFEPENTAALERYEEMLEFIQGKSNITRAQIENSFRAGIRGLISDVIDEEFNKVSFSLSNPAARRTYFSTLIRNPRNGRYTLNYEVPSAGFADVKTISAAARETLINELRRKPAEFDQSDIEAVRAQAALIPAVAFPAAVRDGAVNVITAFYLNPGAETYKALTEKWQELFDQKEPGQVAASAFSRALVVLNEEMGDIGQS